MGLSNYFFSICVFLSLLQPRIYFSELYLQLIYFFCSCPLYFLPNYFLHTLLYLKNKNQIDATCYFIALLIGSICFGHYYAHHQELTTIMLITTLDISFCKDGRGSVNVKLWFLVVYVRREVLCRSVVLDNMFLLILIVVILCVW